MCQEFFFFFFFFVIQQRDNPGWGGFILGLIKVPFLWDDAA